MGDFLQFDSSKANILDDTNYLASTYRTGGCVAGVAPSNAHNKLFYQLSTFVAAFAAAMKAKGYTMSDAILADLQAEFADIVTEAEMEAYAARLAGLSTQAFSAADGSTGKQVVNISQFLNSLAANGYQKFPGGLITQWGTYTFTGAGGVASVSLPITFPTAALNVQATIKRSTTCDAGILIYSAYGEIISTSQIRLVLDAYDAAEPSQSVFWRAWGH